jgi:hypothetical protein
VVCSYSCKTMRASCINSRIGSVHDGKREREGGREREHQRSVHRHHLISALMRTHAHRHLIAQGLLHGEKEILRCLDLSWSRLKPSIAPLLRLVSSEGHALSCLVHERLTRLSLHLDSVRLSISASLNNVRIREYLKGFRELVYEVYGYLRYREEYGATSKMKQPQSSMVSEAGGKEGCEVMRDVEC